MSEFVVRNGLIVSGSTYLEAISQSNEAYILSYDSVTNEVFYQSTASLVPSTASFAITASFALNVPATASTAISASFAATASSADAFYVRGNVGIGVTNPANKFVVSNAGASGLEVDPTGGLGSGVLLQAYNRSTSAYMAQSYYALSHTFNVGSGAATRAVDITSAGNVGIGTTSPNNTLEVKGADSSTVQAIFQSKVSTNDGYNGGIQLGNALASQNSQIYHSSAGDNTLTFISNYSSGTANKFVFAPGGTERVRFLQNGNVGIGTTSPSYNLHVIGEIYASTNLFGNVVYSNTYRDQAGDLITLQDNGGKVAINKTTANATLDVSGSVLISGSLTVSGSSTFTNIGPAVFTGSITQNASTASFGGLVGIGTTTPAYKLDVLGTDDITPEIRIGNSSGKTAFIGFSNTYDFTIDAGGAGGNYLNLKGGANGSTGGIIFSTFALERMQIDYTGNVGIGTTSPGAKLHVVGTESRFGGVASGFISVYNANSRSGYFQANEGSDFRIASDINDMTFYVSGSEKVRFTSGGSVGIGTASPSTKLHVDGTLTITNGGINIPADTPIRKAGDNSIILYSTSLPGISIGSGTATDMVVFNAGGTERVRINTSGSVGIGTTSPTAQLTLFKNAGNQMLQLINGSEAGFRLHIHNSGSVNTGEKVFTQYLGYNDNVNGYISFHRGSSGTNGYLSFGDNGGETVRFSNGGNVGISTTTPAAKLHIYSAGSGTTLLVGRASGNSSIKASADADGGYLSLDSTGGATIINHYVTDNVWLVTGGGNVGIGTNSPTHKLTVLGAVSASSFTGSFSGTSTNAISASFAATASSADAFYVRGNVGLGRIPASNEQFALNVPLNQYAIAFYSGSSFNYGFHTNNGIFNVQGISGSALNFQSLNIGIGTTNPLYKLHVVGSTYVNSGTLFIDSGEYIRWGNSAQGIRGVNDTSLEFVAGSSTRMYVSSSGNVGIGTTNPSNRLDVAGSVQVSSNNFFRYDGDTGIVGSGTGISGGTSTQLGIRAANEILFATSGANERMRITSAGVVGIGTTNPLGLFEVKGDGVSYFTRGTKSLLLNPNVVGQDTNALIDTSTGMALAFATAGTERMRILTGGNVGIGTTNPGAKLTVYSDTTADGILVDVLSRPRITLRDRGNSDTILGTGDYGLDDFFIDTYSGNALVIDGGTRNVGIGTTNPSYKLHVSGGNSYMDGDLTVTGAITAQELYVEYISSSIIYSTGSNKFGDQTSDIQYFTGSILQSGSLAYFAGSVGIGTSVPDVKLDVIGSIRSYSSAGNYGQITNGSIEAVGAHSGTFMLNLDNTGTADLVNIKKSGISRFYITNGGNVGIGTTNPAQKLQVSGSIALNTVTDGTSRYFTYPDINHSWYYDDNIVGSSADVMTYYENFLVRHQDTTNVFLINGSGNVGIGTTAPSEKLVVRGNGAKIKIETASDSGSYFTSIESNYDAANTFNINDGGTLRFGAKALVTYNDTFINGFYNVYIATGTSTNNNAANIRLFVEQGGNVGINTTSPTNKLQVVGGVTATSFTGSFSGSVSAPGSNTQVVYNDAGVLGTSSNFVFSGSRVGIGLTNPTASLQIYNATNPYEIKDMFELTSETLWRLRFQAYHDGGGYDYRIVQNDNGADLDVMTFKSGNVGIGTTSPGAKLHVSYAGTDSSGVRLVGGGGTTAGNMLLSKITEYSDTSPINLFWADHSNTGRNNNLVRIHSNETGTSSLPLRVTAQGTLASPTYEALAVNYAGNVGISTTSPVTKLNLKESNTGTEGFIITNWNGVNTLLLGSDSSSGGGKITLRTNAGTSNVFISSYSDSYLNGGNVGIGTTSPATILHVKTSGNTDTGIRSDVGLDNNVASTPSAIFLNNIGGDVDDGVAATFGIGGADRAKIIAGRYNTGGYLQFQTGDTSNTLQNRVIITNGGNVGIGTTNPSNKLEVDGGSSAVTLRVSTTNTGAGVASLVLSNSSKAAFNDGVKISHGSGYTNISDLVGTNIMTWDMSNTRVGIGTTNPGSLLQVGGSGAAPTATPTAIQLDNTYRNAVGGNTSLKFYLYKAGTETYGIGLNNAGGIEYHSGTAGDTSSYQAFYFGNSEKVRFKGDGNVGIGTTSPGSALHVNGVITVGASVSSFVYGTLAYVDATDGVTLSAPGQNMTLTTGYNEKIVVNGGQNGLQLRTNDGIGNYTDRLLINQTRSYFNTNVGIGTTSPSSLLHVYGSNPRNLIQDPSTGYPYVQLNNSSGNFYLSIDNAAGTGFGSAYGRFLYSDNAYPMIFVTNDVQRMRIASDGNVGIGTTSPSQKLSVYGDIAIANSASIQETRIGKYQSGSLGSGTHTIASISVTNVDAVFFDYVIKNSTTDLRAGTVMAVTNGSTVEYTDISTADIGDTSRITMISDVSGGNIRLRASIDTGAGSWTVRTLLRTI